MERIKKFFREDAWIVLLDIIAVNGAYLLALLTRFYIHFRFTSGVGDFREYYLEFTPYYTVLCILVFFICGLYDGMWRYAGLGDMNRIIGANVITAVIQVVGTRLFVNRMPTSYYLIGAFLQFALTAAIRFAYRFFVTRKQRSDKLRQWTMPAMVVGSDECARQFVRYLEDESLYQVMVVAGQKGGKTMDGVPIVDYASIPVQCQLHDVQIIFIADENLSEAERKEIEAAVEGVKVTDYRDYLKSHPAEMHPGALLRLAEGPITVVIDGEERHYANAAECQASLPEGYVVEHVWPARIELKKREQ